MPGCALAAVWCLRQSPLVLPEDIARITGLLRPLTWKRQQRLDSKSCLLLVQRARNTAELPDAPPPRIPPRIPPRNYVT